MIAINAYQFVSSMRKNIAAPLSLSLTLQSLENRNEIINSSFPFMADNSFLLMTKIELFFFFLSFSLFSLIEVQN